MMYYLLNSLATKNKMNYFDLIMKGHKSFPKITRDIIDE